MQSDSKEAIEKVAEKFDPDPKTKVVWENLNTTLLKLVCDALDSQQSCKELGGIQLGNWGLDVLRVCKYCMVFVFGLSFWNTPFQRNIAGVTSTSTPSFNFREDFSGFTRLRRVS